MSPSRGSLQGSAEALEVPVGGPFRARIRGLIGARLVSIRGRRTCDLRTGVLWTSSWTTWWRTPFIGTRHTPSMHASLPWRRDAQGTETSRGRGLAVVSRIWIRSELIEERVHRMDSRRRPEDRAATDAALDFVRFCHRRRRVGWPELYDEMCVVASRGLYHGLGFGELAEHGIAFGLAEMPRLAGLVAQVAREEVERRGRLLAGVMAPVPVGPDAPEEAPEEVRHPRALVGTAS